MSELLLNAAQECIQWQDLCTVKVQHTCPHRFLVVVLSHLGGATSVRLVVYVLFLIVNLAVTQRRGSTTATGLVHNAVEQPDERGEGQAKARCEHT